MEPQCSVCDGSCRCDGTSWTMTDPRLPVSAEEAGAAENAETAFRDVYDSSEQAAYSTDRVPAMLHAAHAVLVPRIERALNKALLHFRVGGDSLFREYGECCLSTGAINELRAAFWRAMVLTDIDA